MSEPPVYLRGKPKYVTVYKPAPKPVVYTMPIYPASLHDPSYLMDAAYASGLYGAPLMAQSGSKAQSSSAAPSAAPSDDREPPKESAKSGSKFTDYDDESGNYYATTAKKRSKRTQKATPSQEVRRRGQQALGAISDGELDAAANSRAELVELADHDERDQEHDQDDESPLDEPDEPKRSRRTKRQVYISSSDAHERPCSGFPLEVNIRSRIKLDQIFPIHGKSQIRKCVKFPKPTLLPPVEDDRQPPGY